MTGRSRTAYQSPVEDPPSVVSSAVFSEYRTALVNMPFASSTRPSIQLGLLSAIVRVAGFPVDTHYFNLDLASELSPALYERLCEHRGHMFGEWLFGVAAFGASDASTTAAYFDTFPEEEAWAKSVGMNRDLLDDWRRHGLPRFIDQCVSTIDWRLYRFVGFSSTFEQNVASLALARALKELFPDICIVFGGANTEGVMGHELLRSFPFVDLTVSGEGDRVVPALLRCLALGESVEHIQGVISRAPNGDVIGRQALPMDMLDELPTPDYDEYFRKVRNVGLLGKLAPEMTIPFESSRGCWWGAKHHCTFCGLNGVGMGYRKKTPDRLLTELTKLSAAYTVTAFEAVDNIMSTDYVDAVFGKLAENRIDFQFFYEVKANLTREIIRKLAKGGVKHLQPGIESMSTDVLKLMRKGCTMLQNVLCLKWCRYYDIKVSWNVLVGFPGETQANYENQLRVLQSISHLEPPVSCNRVWLERFSPYYTNGEDFGVRNVRASRGYAFAYPEHVDLARIAYFFDYEMPGTIPASCHAATQAWVAHWNDLWTLDRRPTLSYRRTPSSLFVDFDRGPESKGTYVLSGPTAVMYEFCGDIVRSPWSVRRHLLDVLGEDFPESEVREALNTFCDARLMLSEGDKFLSLAIPANQN
jgi:ribosomal peptide maturation radical SAM protein 1